MKKAWWLTADSKCAIRHYDTSVEGEIAQEFGLGCNGVIHVLLERLENSAVSALAAAQPVRRFRAAAMIATVIAASGSSGVETGQRYIRLPDTSVQTNLADPELISFLDSEPVSYFEGPPANVAWTRGRAIDRSLYRDNPSWPPLVDFRCRRRCHSNGPAGAFAWL